MNRRKTVLVSLLMATAIFAAATVHKLSKIDPKTCTNCEACVEVCPVEAISTVKIDGKKVTVVDPKLCTGCGACVKVCPTKSISMYTPGETTAAPAVTATKKSTAK